MPDDSVEDNEDIRNTNKLNIYTILILIISLKLLALDVIIGILLTTQYYRQQTSCAIITLSFIFFPSVIIQILSIKTCLANKNMKALHWVLHCLLLGVAFRYIKVIRLCIRRYKSNNTRAIDSLFKDILNLKNLYLFQTSMECVPQLVFQLYILAVNKNWLSLTATSVTVSILSINWALILHTKAGNMFVSLLLLIIWRICMIAARITALVLCVYTSGPWIILFMGSHWLAMTLWVTYHKAVLDEKDKKNEYHSALFGIIYCLCFFGLKTGQTTCRVVTHNLLLMFENLTFLTVFLIQFSAQSRLAVVSFVLIVFGNIIGIFSFLIYSLFFHSTNNDKSWKESLCCSNAGLQFNYGNFFCVLPCQRIQVDDEVRTKSESEELNDVYSHSDSVIIYEENPVLSVKPEGALQTLSERCENIYEQPKLIEAKMNAEGMKLEAAMKRRAICSSVDLTRFIDKKSDDMRSNRSSKGVNAEETPSEISSTHDYENLCAVNIAREPWGIRSWRGYSDIETWRHDDSVFNERRLDNLTTSSEYSGKLEDKDSLNVYEDDLSHSEIDTNSDKTSLNFLPPLSASMLDTIYEEREGSPSAAPDQTDSKTKYNSESALVATIDKICLYSPLRSRSELTDNCANNTELRGIHEKLKAKTEICLNMERASTSSLRDKNRSIQKLNIFKERCETNQYHVSNNGSCNQSKENESAKENWDAQNRAMKKDTYKPRKRFSFKSKSSLLVHVLTPSKLEKRIFHISPYRK